MVDGRVQQFARTGLRLVAPVTAAALVASLLVVPALPAQAEAADPERPAPPGATGSPPDQPAGTAEGRPHQVSAASTGATEAGLTDVEPPDVPGSVGAEQEFREVELPEAAVTAQDMALSVVEPEVDGYVPGESVEIRSQRQPDSMLFENPDGTKTLRVYDDVVFVPDPDLQALARAGVAMEPGELLMPVDTTLQREPAGRVAPVRAGLVSFGARASDRDLARIELDDGAVVAFGLSDAPAVEPVVDESVVTYPEVGPGADIRFTASLSGVKEEIVLHSADAPTTWSFPLRLEDVTPSLDGEGRTVVFTDGAGEVVGYIPPGFMMDSNIHPRRGDGEVSHGVTYSLERDSVGWVLRVELDEDWLRHPSRVFPVIVDPTYQRNTDSDDTFVSSNTYANQDNSWHNDIKVGTYNGGGERTASYLDFSGLMDARPNRWVHGATLNVYNYWSYSCAARPVDLYKVTESWSGSTTRRWAGPSYGTRLDTRSFAYGYYDCPQGGWGTFNISADRMMRWLHNTESFYGLTLRASSTDSRGWKRFWSANYSDANGRPYIDLNYADQGAKYSLPSGVFNPPVTGGSAGKITVRVTNWGMTTWTPTNGYRLRARVLDSSNNVVQSVPFISMPRNVGPHKSIDIPVTVQPVQPGNYKLQLYMVTPDTQSFQTAYGVPYAQSAFKVANGAPTIVGNWPAHNGYVESLTPRLWADYFDPDNFPEDGSEYYYRACEGPPGGGGSCQNSGWVTSSTWPLPEGMAEWYEPVHWYVRVSDGSLSSPEIGPFVFTPTVAQPPITSHLAGAPEDADVPGLNPLVGNYFTAVTDVSVATVGQPLAVTRTYNSQDLRESGAFGPGWSSSIDQRVDEDDDGSGNVVVTLPSGRQLRFGRSADGTYVPPPGANLTLVRTASLTGWTLRDAAGSRRVFDSLGRLKSVTNADGHQQWYSYLSTGLREIRDVVSDRYLQFTWSGSRVTSIVTNQPSATEPGSTWSYSYTDGLLTEVCAPLSASSCTTYGYAESSHYRSVVLDHNPAGYWPLAEESGTVAANIASLPGDRDATYVGDVTLGLPGGLPGSPDTAMSTDGGGDESGLSLPTDVVNVETGYALEFWFKQEPDEHGGILWSTQTGGLGETSSRIATFNVGDTSGLFYSYKYPGGGVWPIFPKPALNDGQWHHVVLSHTPGSNLQVYQDGAYSWQVTNYFFNGRFSYIGNGNNGEDDEFGGTIDDVAYYRHPLGADQIAAHYAAGSSSRRLISITEPGGFVATQINYDHVTGRVASLTDRHGEVWRLTELNGSAAERTAVLSSEGGGSIAYHLDLEHGGRLVSRSDASGEEAWEYNEAGFVSKATDANGNVTTFATDERGNVIGRTTCRAAGDCATEYFGYFHNENDPLDPRNDALIWEADGRSASASDLTYRTTYDLDDAGRVIEVTYPIPDGHTTAPTETFTYTTGEWNPPGYEVADEPRAFIPANDAVLPISSWDDEVEVTLPFPIEIYGAQNSSVEVDGMGALRFDAGILPAYVCTLCGYWEVDASASVRTAVVGTVPDRQFVVEWRNVGHYYDMSQRVSMQAVISESGEIALNYDDPEGVVSNAGFSGIFLGEFFDYVSPQSVEIADDTAAVFSPTSGGESYTVDEEPSSFVSAGSALPLSGDDEVLGIDLPFPITHYGVTYDEAWISTNGYVSFEEAIAPPGPFHWQTPLPSATEPNAAVYPLWEDFVVDASASVRTEVLGTAPDRTFVIEWRNVHVYGHSGARISFEVLLSEDGRITINYDDADEFLTEPWFFLPMVGVENESGDAAVEYPAVTGRPAGGIAQVFTLATPGAGTPVEGLLEESVGPNGGVTSYEYDWRGDLVRTAGPVGLVEEYIYDGLGRVTSVTASDGTEAFGTTTYTYNPLSMVEAVTAPAVTNPITGDTHVELTTHTYDDAGRRTGTTVADATGSDPARTWQWQYDPAGRLVSTTAPDGGVTTQEWNSRGDVVRVTQPGGLVLEYAYDDSHRRIETAAVGAGVDPLAPAATRLVLESRAYDPGGRLASVVDAMGRETAFTYFGDNLPAGTARVRRDENGNITSETMLIELDYNRAGLLTDQTTAGGVTTTYTHDAAGYLLSEVFDPGGLDRTKTYERNLDGTPAAVLVTGAESPGRAERVSYTYDMAGRLLTETVDNTGGFPAELTTTYVRDPRGLVMVETDPGGTRTWFGYDASGLVTTVTGEARDVWDEGVLSPDVQPVTRFGRNTFGEVTHEQDPTGSVLRLTLDNMGRSTELHLPGYTPPGGDPIQAVEYTQYDQRGLPVLETDALGRVTELEYDVHGRLVSRTLPDPDGEGPLEPPVWSYGYDRAGQLLETTDPTGGQLLATYDDLGRQVTETVTDRTTGSTLYLTTGFGYDDAGNRTSVTTPLGRTTTTDYNRAGQPLRVTDPSGRFTESAYDLAGRVVSSVMGRAGGYTDPATTYAHDLAGRQVAVTQCTASAAGACGTVLASGAVGYDAVGRPVQETTPAGRVSSYGYDAAGQLASITQLADVADPGTAVTVALGYDASGRRTRMVDGNGDATVYTYMPWSLPESVIEPATPAHPDLADRTWTTVYDAAGQAVQQRLPGGVSRDSTYDGLGNRISETGAGAEAATVTRQLRYDALGRITSISRPDGDTSYTWDDRGLPIEAVGAAGTASFVYNGDGQLLSRTDAAGAATFTYGLTGEMETASDPLTGATATFGYHDNGALATMAWSSGASREFTLDNLGRVASDVWLRPDETVAASTNYTYDDDALLVGRDTTGVAGGGTNAYGYDGLGRLVSWTRPDDQVVTYGYDAASNRITVDGPDGIRTATYDARGRQLSATGGGDPDLTQTWTARGTLATTTEGTAAVDYDFDAFERLAEVTGPAFSTGYTYDALDRLATSGGHSHQYADLTNNPVHTPAGSSAAVVVRSPDGTPLSGQNGTEPGQALLADPVHADVVAAADPGTGNLSASASYEPYGEVADSDGFLPLGYQGGWTDPATSQVNAHARWYDPGSGAFTSRDTWTLEPDPTAQSNRYLYGNANPVTNADPSGHQCLICPFVPHEYCPPICAPTVGDCPPFAGIGQYCGGSGSSPSPSPSTGNGFGSAPPPPRTSPTPQGTPPQSKSGSGSGPGVPPVFVPPVVPPVFVPPPVAPRPDPWGRGPSQPRPKPDDPTGGDGIGNPVPRNPVQPRITNDGGGSAPSTNPPGAPTLIPPALTAPLGALLEAVSVLGATGIAGGLASLIDQLAGGEGDPAGDNLTEAERRRRDDCLSGRIPVNEPFYFPVEPTAPDHRLRTGRATGGEICILGGSYLQGESNISGAKYTPTGHQDGVHDRGHLIANSLGGSDLRQANIVPLFPCANDLMEPIERLVRDRTRTNNETIYYRVEAVYNGSNPVPVTIRIVALGNKGTMIAAPIPNTQECT